MFVQNPEVTRVLPWVSHAAVLEDNAVPIKSWFCDPSDTALLNLLPVLDALRFCQDVRSVLGRNLHLHRLW
jgi:TFIIF-interacting CTD phosphatase-like protein